MGFFDKLKSKAIEVAGDAKKKYKHSKQGLGEIEDDKARENVVQLTFLMAASDGEIDKNEIESIYEQFGMMWHDNNQTVVQWITEYNNLFIKEQESGITKKNIVQSLFSDCVDELKTSLSTKQKKELTQYLIEVMQADGEVDANERALLMSYKDKVGLDGDFFTMLASGAKKLFNDQCPECKEFQVNEYDKKKIGTHRETQSKRDYRSSGGRDISYTERREVTKTTFLRYLSCDVCSNKWTKEKIETQNGPWHR